MQPNTSPASHRTSPFPPGRTESATRKQDGLSDWSSHENSVGKRSRTQIVSAIIAKLEKEIGAGIKSGGKDFFRGTGLLELTEYGRAAHAEMEALLCCARVGVSAKGGTLFSTTFPCHNCAKHIIAAGIKRVVYVEPYPKSQALRLHADAIAIDPPEEPANKVSFVPFVGIGPRRFFDLFSLKLGAGREVERKTKGEAVKMDRNSARVRVPLLPFSYLEKEKKVVALLNQLTEVHDGD